MKKVFGVLTVSLFASAILFNMNTVKTSENDLDLSSLIAISIANAESGPGDCTSSYERQFCMYVEYCADGGSTDCS